MKKKIKVKKIASGKTVRKVMRALKERKLITSGLTDEELLILSHAVIQAILFDERPISKKYPRGEGVIVGA